MPVPALHSPALRPIAAQSQRLAAWKKIRGLWKHRATDPIQELRAIRGEMERALPPLGE